MIPWKDKKLRNCLDDLINLVYTESVIRRVVDKMLSNLKKIQLIYDKILLLMLL